MERQHTMLDVFDNFLLKEENVKPFPAVVDLACISHTVYHQKFKTKGIFDISESRSDQVKINPLPDSWKLMGTAQCKDGYHGAAYYNESKKYIVVAHRGTELTNLGALWTDMKGIVFNGYTSQMNSAYKFTKTIVDMFWECGISITITGHSLGGWLSQTSAFFIKYQKFTNEFSTSNEHELEIDINQYASGNYQVKDSHHLHVVVFDSPGALNIVESFLLKNILRYSNDRSIASKYLDSLDFTTYFSSPNVINSTNMHIGSLYMMPNISDKKGSISTLTDIVQFTKYTFDSHNMKKIVNFWQSGASCNLILKVTDWPIGFRETNMCLQNEFTKTKFKVAPFDINSVRMSVFDLEEREFVEEIQYLKIYGLKNENIAWETMFKNKDLTKANSIFGSDSFKYLMQAKNVFDFFDSFEVFDSQVLTVMDKTFAIDFFIRLVKYFVKSTANLNLTKLVKEVISEFPKVYQAIYQGFSTEFLKRVPQVQVNDFTALQDFLESSQYKVYQVVANQSTFICVAKIVQVLKSKNFKLPGSGSLNLVNSKNSLFLNSDFLTILCSHVDISRIVPVKDNLKLILIENCKQHIQPPPALQTLIKNVVESSTVVKLILVTSAKINDQQFNTSFPYYLETIITPSDQSISFQDLSDYHQTLTLDSEVCFQGEDMPLRDLVTLADLRSNAHLFDHSTLISLLSKTYKPSFGGTIPTLSEFEKSYYIKRHFHRIILKNQEQLFSVLKSEKSVIAISYDGNAAKQEIETFFNSKKDKIFTFEWKGNFVEYDRQKVVLIECEQLSPTPNYNSLSSYFRSKGLEGYWLLYDNESWYWQATFGKQSLQSLNIEYAEQYDENKLFVMERPLVIITDEPGMGKSTLLKYFAGKCKEIGRASGKASCVIFVNLENSKEFFSSFKVDSININTVIDLLCIIDRSTAKIEAGLLNFFLQQNGRTTIFFDGLDEVIIDIQSKVFTIAKFLLDHTFAKVYISSRLHLRSSLETYFSNYIHKFYPLTEPERIDFLANFWTNHPDLCKYKMISSLDVVKTYASHLLKQLHASLNIMQADAFVGVPLQLFMLGSISLAQVSAFFSEVQTSIQPIDSSTLENHTLIFGNIFNLYQMFANEKCRISLEEKCKLTQLSEHYPWHNQILISALIELNRKISFLFLFPDESKVFISNLNKEEIQVVLGVGIVHSVSIDLTSIQFIHRSLAEYFAADFIVSRLSMKHFKDKAIYFLKQNIFLPNFDKIRFFVDHFISIHPECNTIFHKCLEWEKEKDNILEIMGSSEYRNKDVLDLLGRNVLHYAICYGDHNYGILWVLVQNQHLFNKTDLFGCSFLSYAIISPKLIEMKFLHPRPRVTLQYFLKCFYPHLLDKVVELPDIDWIMWFSGQRAHKLNQMLTASDKKIDTDTIQSQFKEELEADSKFFGEQNLNFSRIIREGPIKLPADLFVAAMRGDSETKRPSIIRIFIETFVDYIVIPEKLTQSFEIAMTIRGNAHIKVGMQIYVKVRYNKNAAQLKRMLNILARNDFAIFKKAVEFFSDELVIESDLWWHCKKRKKELFHIDATTNYVTFRRALLSLGNQSEARKLVDEFCEMYKTEKDENIRKAMQEIIREDDDLASKKAFELGITSIWELLPTLDVKEEVLSKHYVSLKKCVIEKVKNSSNTSKNLAHFLIKIHASVGSDWQKTIDDDVNLKPFKSMFNFKLFS